MQGIKLPFIKSLPFPAITLEEQKRIVAVLDQAFAALDRARANADANLADAAGLYEAELRSIFYSEAKAWDLYLLPALCTHFGRGKSKHRPRNDPKLYGGDIPFIQTGDISNAQHEITVYRQTYSEDGLAQSRLWPKGTVCVAIVGATIGESGILTFDACFPDSVIGLRPDPSKCSPEYLEFLLQAFKNDLKEDGKGSARDNINLRTFKTRRFPVPELSVQREVVVRLLKVRVAAQSLIDSYDRRLNEIGSLRESLLNWAFAGRLT